MLFEDIDWTLLESMPHKLAWGANDPLSERHFYRADGLVYKIWGELYNAKDYIVDGDSYQLHQYRSTDSGTALIDIGFISQSTCPALVDLIWDKEKRCRGYITREGRPLVSMSEIDPEFLREVCATSRRTGYFHTDLCPKNLISIDGRTSLIDLDTVPSLIGRANLDFELRRASMRRHVVPQYRLFILDTYLEPDSGEQASDEMPLLTYPTSMDRIEMVPPASSPDFDHRIATLNQAWEHNSRRAQNTLARLRNLELLEKPT